MRIDARSILTIDPLGRLVRFDSAVKLDPFNETIELKGVVEEGREAATGGAAGKQADSGPQGDPVAFRRPVERHPFSPDAAAGPAAESDLDRAGLQPVHAGAAVADHPATVERRTEPYTWNGTTQDVWYVAYRDDAGMRHGRRASARGEVWVRPDGMVLQQKVMLFNAPLLFVRMTDDEAKKLVERAGPHWWTLGNEPQGRDYD